VARRDFANLPAIPGLPLAVTPSDAARRAADIINGYVAFIPRDELKHKYVAIRLADGGSDGNLYDSKRDAVRHQLDEKLCAYVSFAGIPAGTNNREMEVFLKFNRDVYDAGIHLADPDDHRGGREVLMTTRLRDYYRGQGYV
jgi:hypothetical protein